MSISLQCTGCGAEMEAPPSLAGRKCRCPECGTHISIPTAAPTPATTSPPTTPGPPPPRTPGPPNLTSRAVPPPVPQAPSAANSTAEPLTLVPLDEPAPIRLDDDFNRPAPAVEQPALPDDLFAPIGQRPAITPDANMEYKLQPAPQYEVNQNDIRQEVDSRRSNPYLGSRDNINYETPIRPTRPRNTIWDEYRSVISSVGGVIGTIIVVLALKFGAYHFTSHSVKQDAYERYPKAAVDRHHDTCFRLSYRMRRRSSYFDEEKYYYEMNRRIR